MPSAGSCTGSSVCPPPTSSPRAAAYCAARATIAAWPPPSPPTPTGGFPGPPVGTPGPRAHLGPRPGCAVRPAPARRAPRAPRRLGDPDRGQARLLPPPRDAALARPARGALRPPRGGGRRDAPPRLRPREPARSAAHDRSGGADRARRSDRGAARPARAPRLRLREQRLSDPAARPPLSVPDRPLVDGAPPAVDVLYRTSSGGGTVCAPDLVRRGRCCGPPSWLPRRKAPNPKRGSRCCGPCPARDACFDPASSSGARACGRADGGATPSVCCRRAGRRAAERRAQEYIASISPAYFSAIGLRLSFIVGVSSSPPGAQSPRRIVNFFTCSTRASSALPLSTAAWTAARTASSSARSSSERPSSPCWAANAGAKSESSTTSAVL